MSAGRAGWGIVALAPAPALFAFFRAYPDADLHIGSANTHFWIVSGISALALVLALAVIRSASTLPDPRTFFLSLGFLSMATIFLAHGLGTSPLFPGGPRSHPGVHAGAGTARLEDTAAAGTATAPAPADSYGSYVAAAEPGTADLSSDAARPDAAFFARLRVVGYSAQLSLLVSAVFFALATVSLPRGVAAAIQRHRTGLTETTFIALAGHVVIALAFPETMARIPLGSDPLRYGIGIAATGGFAFAAWRFYESHRLAMLPMQAAMAVGMLLLIEAQYFMLAGELWRLSWWEYHVAMLIGFGICVVTLLRQHRVTGDLGAIVEGLFLREQVRGLRKGDPGALTALGAALTAKDTETAGHTDRVGVFAVAVGQRMGLPDERMRALRWAGQLHDIGKLGVPNGILRKRGQLTADEFEVIKRHSVRGFQIAARSQLLAPVATIIRAHHERMDGTGYPDGLAGSDIPREARIVAVADVWDALTCDRPYRAAMAWQEAGRILAEGAGSHFDPDCVEALLDVLGLPDLSRFLRNDLPEVPGLAA